MFLNDYGARWYNPQLNQWHQIDPLAENYYALSSYNYVANNPIKYIDPDGQWVSEFDEVQAPPGGENPPEVPGCPECDPIGMLREVLITATRLIGPQTLEEQLAYLEETKEIREENQNTMYPLPQATGSLDVDNSLVQLFAGPEDVVLIGGAKLLGFVPIILRGVKWGAPVGKVTYGAAKTFKSFTRSNFRHNLGKLTGNIPANSQAHHVFPYKYATDFSRAGINIHDPKFGVWWETSSHLKNASGYNIAWENFLKTNPTQSQILNKGRQLMQQYGFSTNF